MKNEEMLTMYPKANKAVSCLSSCFLLWLVTGNNVLSQNLVLFFVYSCLQGILTVLSGYNAVIQNRIIIFPIRSCYVKQHRQKKKYLAWHLSTYMKDRTCSYVLLRRRIQSEPVKCLLSSFYLFSVFLPLLNSFCMILRSYVM